MTIKARSVINGKYIFAEITSKLGIDEVEIIAFNHMPSWIKYKEKYHLKNDKLFIKKERSYNLSIECNKSTFYIGRFKKINIEEFEEKTVETKLTYTDKFYKITLSI